MNAINLCSAVLMCLGLYYAFTLWCFVMEFMISPDALTMNIVVVKVISMEGVSRD